VVVEVGSVEGPLEWSGDLPVVLPERERSFATVDPLLAMQKRSQAVATAGHGSQVSTPLSAAWLLPAVAVGCDRSAP
jgi:hypothetical protein